MIAKIFTIIGFVGIGIIICTAHTMTEMIHNLISMTAAGLICEIVWMILCNVKKLLFKNNNNL